MMEPENPPQKRRKETHLQQTTGMKKVEPWPLETLQVVEHHLGYLQKPVREQRWEDGQRLAAHCEMVMGPDLDLECEVALPHGWEQFLDLRTGQVYYIDWRNCRRSYIDPRKIDCKKGSIFLESQSEITEQEETSGCVSDGHGKVKNTEVKKEMVNDNLITYPMQQEDWNIMESRGWPSLMNNDDNSEVGSTMSENIRALDCENEKCDFVADADS